MIAYALIGIGTSFIGSFIAILVVLHYDLEGLWEQRRLEHGKKLDQRQLEAARKHGHKSE